LAGGWRLMLVCSGIKVLLADCWWLVCSERKVLLAGGEHSMIKLLEIIINDLAQN
jgi:hypothetical protein